MRIYLVFLVFLSIFFSFTVKFVSAETNSTVSASIVDSYNLFWPLTAGKAEGDSLYFMKLFKEKIVGWFIFGDIKKADYAIYLGTKRVLEAEKLLKDGKNDLAIKTLGKAKAKFTSAYKNVKIGSANRKILRDEIRRDRLIYVKTLIDYMKSTVPEEIHSPLDSVKDSADSILRDYLP